MNFLSLNFVVCTKLNFTFIFCSSTLRYPLLDTIGDTRTSSISGTNAILPMHGDFPVEGPLPLLPSVAGVPDEVITE